MLGVSSAFRLGGRWPRPIVQYRFDSARGHRYESGAIGRDESGALLARDERRSKLRMVGTLVLVSRLCERFQTHVTIPGTWYVTTGCLTLWLFFGVRLGTEACGGENDTAIEASRSFRIRDC